VLARLAQLYECHIADLLADCGDFRHNDPEYRARDDLVLLHDLAVDGRPGGNAEEERPQDPMTAFIKKVQEMNAEELSRAIASWAVQMEGGGMNRRQLLLKLSAGLSLAAADPVISNPDRLPTESNRAFSQNASGDLSGIWSSRYTYHSSSQNRDLEAEHYVVLHQRASRLIGQSLPHSMDSKLRLDLSVDGPIATGTWIERTSPSGYYRGATYHGTLQLIVNPMGRAMNGRWLGFGKDFTVDTGEWELNWMDGSTSPRVMRQYHLKA
jgi:hypothetical protein